MAEGGLDGKYTKILERLVGFERPMVKFAVDTLVVFQYVLKLPSNANSGT